jgi:hypothetical protein
MGSSETKTDDTLSKVRKVEKSEEEGMVVGVQVYINKLWKMMIQAADGTQLVAVGVLWVWVAGKEGEWQDAMQGDTRNE